MMTVAIIQARMGSSRLPGKVLMDLGGRTMLERIVRRVRRCKRVDQVAVATSVSPLDDRIVTKCEQIAVPVFRGSELDVLDRFMGAARAFQADVCIRITADCPLIDPEVTDYIIDRFWQANPAVDYASNKIPQSYPRGLDTEVFTLSALERAWQRASRPYERAHVTVYIYEHPEQFKLLSITSDVDRADWRWTVDTIEDLKFVREIYDRLGPDDQFSWRDVLSLLDREPALRKINSHVRQKPAREG